MPPTIPATRPLVVPAREEIVYDQWVKASLAIEGTGVGADRAHGTATFRRARTLPDGAVELEPGGQAESIVIDDLAVLAGQYPEVRAALEAVEVALVRVGRDRTIL